MTARGKKRKPEPGERPIRYEWFDLILDAPADNVYGIDAYTVLVAAILHRHMNAEGECWPSMYKMAREAKCSRPTIEGRVVVLEQAGLLRVRRHHRSAHRYKALIPDGIVWDRYPGPSSKPGKLDDRELANGVSQNGESSQPRWLGAHVSSNAPNLANPTAHLANLRRDLANPTSDLANPVGTNSGTPKGGTGRAALPGGRSAPSREGEDRPTLGAVKRGRDTTNDQRCRWCDALLRRPKAIEAGLCERCRIPDADLL